MVSRKMSALCAFYKRVATVFLLVIFSLVSTSGLTLAYEQPYQCTDFTTLPNVPIPHYIWKPSSTPKAIIFGFHGGCLHGRAYCALAHDMIRRGNMLVSFDMRGYGQWYHSDYGTKEDKTFNYKNSLADAKVLARAVRAKYPGVPMYLIGESLGGNVAAIMAQEAPQMVDGVIMVNPFAKPKLFLSPRMIQTALEVAIKPIGKVNMSPYLEKRLSTNEVWGQMQSADPMSRNKQTLKELGQSLAINMRGKKALNQLQSNIPILVMVGGQDKMCSPEANARMYAKIPSRNKKFVEFPSLGHMIVEAPQVVPVVTDSMTGWIRRQQALAMSNKKKPSRMIARSKNTRAFVQSGERSKYALV